MVLIGLSLALVALVAVVAVRDALTDRSTASVQAAAAFPAPGLPDSHFLLPPTSVSVSSAETSTSAQTSEFMAGKVAVSVVFVESSGGTGNCAPADTQTENWSAARRSTVLAEIGEGMQFWISRSNRPDLSFIIDDQGAQPTSCEPITRAARGVTSDEPKWAADALTAMGYPATTSDYFSAARAFINSRRTALAADWGFVILVVDSLSDTDGAFSNGAFAYAYLNGPIVVTTYDNASWGISRMSIVMAHETGHVFGALDEYAVSGCTATDSWGYLNAANTSCNNGGTTSDYSIMGESVEQIDSRVDVSSSARNAVGWRNPAPANGHTVVDVVRTSSASLTPYTPDPTTDDRPLFSALARNVPYPPQGPRRLQGTDYGNASPASISRVVSAEWNLDGGPFSSAAAAGSGDVPYTFGPASPVPGGIHTFGTRAINNFGHQSALESDALTISGPPATPTATPTPSIPFATPIPGTTPTPTATQDPLATSTPTMLPYPGDSDGDGCADVREAGPDARFGGRRDYLNPWDFFDTDGDGAINLGDLGSVSSRFATYGQVSGPSPHTGEVPSTGYHPTFDRGPVIGPNPWNVGPPDGRIGLSDVMDVAVQFGHTCS